MTSYWLASHPIAERGAPLVAGSSYDTVVVGAGLTGLTTAVLLARAGRRPCLVEGRTVGAVTTGNTTAKVSLLQGSLLSAVRRRHGDEVLRAYVEANLAGQQWLLGFLDDCGVDYQRRPAFSYAQTRDGQQDLELEYQASVAAHLPVEDSAPTELPYEVAGAIRLPDQAQIHPTEVLDALLTQFLASGGVLHTDCRVTDVSTRHACRITTSLGELGCDNLVLATGTPILDRGGHFARLQAQRSYAVALRAQGQLPQGMYLSIDSPTRSLRTVPTADGELLLVGGNGHQVGREDSPKSRLDELLEWAGKQFPGAVATHTWSAQDYRPSADLPLVGELASSGGRVRVATGYHKWGMTNSVAAALRLTAGLSEAAPPAWATVLDDAQGKLGLGQVARFGVEVAASATAGWVKGEARSLRADPPTEGSGVVGRLGVRPAARSTVNGRTCTVSAVCTHMGGILTWNDAELSWDCPLHGSRFDAAGKLLEGPAVDDLELID